MYDEEILTVTEAAQWLRISRNTAYDLVARGELPSFRLGSAIRLLKIEVIDSVQRKPEEDDRE